MKMLAACVVAAGCSSSPSPSPERPAQPPPPAIPVDASPDAGIPADAPAWIFRFNAPGRLETWTLRYSGELAAVAVESARGTTRYFGSAADGTSLVLTLSAGAATLTLDCKRNKLAVSGKCNDPKAPKVDVLDCFHPDFKTPMSFGSAPGIEYVTSAACTGYRLIAQ